MAYTLQLWHILVIIVAKLSHHNNVKVKTCELQVYCQPFFSLLGKWRAIRM